MESKNFILTVSPLKVVAASVVILFFVGAYFLWTSIGSLKSQVAEQQKQLEDAKKRDETQQTQINQVVQFLNNAIQQSQAK